MRTHFGFTLIELVITITVVAILTAVGIPSYRSVATPNRMSSEVNQLVGDLQYARSEAVRQGQNVVICSVANPSSSTPACGTSASWQNGWFIFADNHGTGVYESGDVLLKQEVPFTGGANADSVLAIGASPSVSSLKALSFNRDGFSGRPGTTTFEFHDVTNNRAFTKCTAVSIVGYITLEGPGIGGCS